MPCLDSLKISIWPPANALLRAADLEQHEPRNPASPYVYQTIQVKANTKAELALGATFSIPKKWIENHTEIKLAKYNKQNWQTTPIQKTGESKTHIHYKADIKQGTYTIYSKERTKHTSKMPWMIAGVVLVIAAIILLTPQQASKGIPPQIWKQDTTHSIDLSNYFTDPDGDMLTYSVTETQNIIIDITGNTAHMTPKTGWTGEEQVKFIADDGKEGKMTSNTVPLRVSANIISQKTQTYLAIALGLLALLILTWATRSPKKRK